MLLIFSGVRQASRPVFIQGYRQAPHRSQDRAYEDKNVKSVRLKQHISKSSVLTKKTHCESFNIV